MKNNDKLIILVLFLAIFAFLIWKLSSVLAPFVASFVIAYFLRPLVKYFLQKNIPDSFSVLMIMALFFVVFGAVISVILPIIYKQSSQMIAEIPNYVNIFKTKVYPSYLEFLTKVGIAHDGGESFVDEARFISFAKKFTAGVFSSGLSVINVFSFLFIMPILIFYLLKDWDLLNQKFEQYLPKNSSKGVRDNLRDIDNALSGYVRGQILVCISMAAIYSLLLSVTGLNFGFLIGFLTGIFSFIPYVGALMGFAAAILTASFQWGVFAPELLFVVLAIVIGQVVESNFLTPKLIGDKVGLHPVWVIFGIFVFGSLFGFVGVLFAMPLTAVAGVLIKNLAQKYKKLYV